MSTPVSGRVLFFTTALAKDSDCKLWYSLVSPMAPAVHGFEAPTAHHLIRARRETLNSFLKFNYPPLPRAGHNGLCRARSTFEQVISKLHGCPL